MNIRKSGGFSECSPNYKGSLDPIIMGYITGYKIPSLEIPFQNPLPPPVKMTKQENVVVLKETQEMLKKEAIIPVKHEAQ